MHIFVGSDHGGFALKELVLRAFPDAQDLGAHELDPEDDYPQYAHAVAEKVAADPDVRGILLCRSGSGMLMAANRHAGVRAFLAWNADIVQEARHDNDANIMVVAADFETEADVLPLIDAFLHTSFSGDARHVRRIAALDKGVA